MLASTIPLALGATLLHAVADKLPNLDIETGCRVAAKIGDELSLDTTLGQCLGDEKSARAELEKQWTQLSPALRQRCVATTETGDSPSYVEVLVCLQRGQEAARMDKSSPGRNQAKHGSVIA